MNTQKSPAFGGNSSLFGQNKSTNSTEQSLITLIRKELQDWEVSKLWPLSCFAAQKDQQCLPGLQDTSPEELRIEAYKCIATGQLKPYLDGLATLSSKTMTRRNQLKSMNDQQLIQEINAASSTPSSGDLFSRQPTSLFSTQQGSSGLFNTSSTGLFGSGGQNKSSGPFASASQNISGGLFGQNTSSSLGGGLFGSSSNAPSNPFVKSNNSTAVFGGSTGSGGSTLFFNNPATPSAGLFSKNTGGGLFSSTNNSLSCVLGPDKPVNAFPTPSGISTNPFGASTSTGLFSSLQTQGSGGLFGGSQNTGGGGLFGGSTSGVFGSSQSTSRGNSLGSSNSSSGGGLFTSQQTNVAANTSSTQQTSSAPVNPFLSQAMKEKKAQQQQQYQQLQQQQPAGASQSIVKIPEITPEDLAKFQADKFILGQIPTCPPPPESCT
ncbi:uncharacterized protein LOC130647961 isoform X2 [Hydractinia symbiolongicarpus]|uniref:uncharacterized protein LOC130647961 isoform X2 n=1 Tax=Hydractinia symbiolongicarpus TaxID=13093 RepID=UPI00254A0740|nr:uncharacterized protein LOC130647961 isoform X2 [Hydractinia symbiolongicarpus]